MNFIKKIIEITFKAHKRDWDTVLAIVGDEGKSKSNLALHQLDYWYVLLNGECKKEDIKHMCLDLDSFVSDLSDLQKRECTVYDEAGDLSNRNFMTKINKKIAQTYQVIRSDNLLTILVLPSLFDLDPFFKARRIKGLFVVYQRGKTAFWGQSKLRQIIELNRNRNVKNYWVVPPDFIDNFPIYKGVLAKDYIKLKEDKTKNARKMLVKDLNGISKEKITPEEAVVEYLKDSRGYNYPQIAKERGYTKERARQIYIKGKEKRANT
jgi:hypothetical protein|tara:strand:+ start:1648 stop:2442 length:795 start_codon:yes stop_codon:yes gene_type:complete